MKYIIADPKKQNGIDLKEILDGYEMLDFQGSFTTLEAIENSISRGLPDLAFIRIGEAELNAFKLVGMFRGRNPFPKVILMSSYGEYAVEAFEWEADGFLLLPFSVEKIRHLLLKVLEKRRSKENEADGLIARHQEKETSKKGD